MYLRIRPIGGHFSPRLSRDDEVGDGRWMICYFTHIEAEEEEVSAQFFGFRVPHLACFLLDRPGINVSTVTDRYDRICGYGFTNLVGEYRNISVDF